MRKCWIMVCFVLATAFPAAACDHSTDEKPVILVVGDSLSAAYGIDTSDGWVALLQQRLEERSMDFRVVNASISGDTTSGGLARLRKALPEHQPRLVVIALGGNDGLRGLPLKSMNNNISTMIALAGEQGAHTVLLGMRIPSNYGPRYTERFHAIYGELAGEHGLPYVPFFMEGVALNTELMQADGIHPNEAAQPVLLDTAWPAIEQGLATVCQASR